MTAFAKILTALAAAALAGPAAAQYPYPQQPYPQPYPGQPYPGQPYGYSGGGIGSIIDQLLGNRYNVTDRTAVSQCASAAMAQASREYRPYSQGYGGGYNQGYGGYGGYSNMRVTAITDVQRRSSGLRVRGLIDSGFGNRGGGYGGYGQGYANRGYGGGDLTFRCNVDYRGYVTNVRLSRNDNYRRY